LNLLRKTYCTIITLDYIHYALTLNESLLSQDQNVQLKVLISDSKSDLSVVTAYYPNVEFFFVDQLCHEGLAKKIYEKYATSDMDCFRWSLKPIFINFLLDRKYDQVFLLDCDLYFFSSFDFLSDDLEGNSVLLTPHWRASIPELDETNFSILLTSGLFNAGFVGVSQQGRPAMEWWAGSCAYKCQKAPDQGLFVDQAYLDLFPVYFDNVAIERHRGCNIATWNQIECERILSENGKTMIKGDYEIVFIHFTKSTIKGIKTGRDYLLRPFLGKYQKSLDKYKTLLVNSTDILTKSNPSETKITKTKFPLSNNLATNDLFLDPKLSVGTLDRYFVRHSILKALKNRLGDFRGKLLDVGCGQKPYKPLLTAPPSRVTQYIGLDLENNPIHDNHPDIIWQKGKIPLDDRSIDCAIATEVFEHCLDPGSAMSEIHRVLKPGGLLFLTVPFLWPLHEVPYDNYRYTPFSLSHHLSASGFIDIDLKPLGGWDASLAQMLGLWVRRQAMGKWKRKFLSILLMPVVFLLYRGDERTISQFHESMMLTGLSGTALRPEEKP